MSWTDILTDEEIAELESLLDGDGRYEIAELEIDDEDAWALSDMD